MTALLIALSTAVVCLSVALWRSRQTVRRQTEEIEALLAHSLELRGQAAELATLAHDAQGRVAELEACSRTDHKTIGDLHGNLAATKRKLAAARGRITRLTR